MKKNDIVTVKIEDISVNGEGIGKVDGYTLFIKDTVIGDTVEAGIMKMKKRYGYARLVRVISPSPDRVPARCPTARQCGGCQIQAMSYNAQLRFKEKKVRMHLQKIGGLTEELLDEVMEPVCGMEDSYRYRNKAQYPVGTDRDGKPVAGFYAGRTHRIIPNTDCVIGAAVNGRILENVLQFMEEYRITAYNETERRGLIRHVLIRCGYHTKEIMVCVVINGTKIPHAEKLVERLRKIEGMTSITFSVNTDHTNVIMGRQIVGLWGQDYITDMIGDIRYRISPLSFYQVNPVQTEKLYRTALEYANLHGTETVWDLYCGIGTISLFLAQRARRVYGVEVIPQAIEDAGKNAEMNGIENVEFYAGRAEDVLPEKYAHDGIRADVVVVDPPRKGCETSVLDTIVKMGPEKIVYVSCDSATLARDVKYLGERGYEVRRARPVDMFPQGVHVETVCLLSKLNVEHHIEVELTMDEMDLTTAESKATYEEIKNYVKEKTGLQVSNLYIAQIKRKCGIIERINYNLPKSETSRQPKCPPEKETAIIDALKHFQMI